MKIIIALTILAYAATSTAQLPQVYLTCIGNNLNDRVQFKYGQFSASNFASLSSTYFTSTKKTIVWIYGWRMNLNDYVSANVINKLLLRKSEFNILVIEWSYYSMNNNVLNVANQLRGVAKSAASLLNTAKTGGLNINTVHLVGMSFGVLIAGEMGRIITSPAIPRISALEPPSVAFGIEWVMIASGLKMIEPKCAIFVDVIHTDTINAGYPYSVGHVDFYVNGGSNQPNCSGSLDCSHKRSIDLFLESVGRNPPSLPFIASSCSATGGPAPSDCSASMGYYADITTTNRNPTIKVNYYVATTGNPQQYSLV